MTILVSCDFQLNQGGFKLLSKDDASIDFVNRVHESDTMNYFTYPYLYMGAGVGIGDFNNDGLEDVFFTANQEKNALYLNKGDFKFENISKNAGVEGDGRWYTGVSLVDINNDGWLDIYLSVAGQFAPHTNELWINNGDLTFTESAQKYGVDDEGYSYQGTFFDYDLDGDLDLLVINYQPTPFGATPLHYQRKMQNCEWLESDHLYENVDGVYIDKTEQSGLKNFGLTISASVSDFNQDGRPDILLCNDFASPDLLFLNNGDKTFKEVMKQSMGHVPLYSMGSDAADINNDGLVDLLQLDMNAQDNFRNKANMASMNIPRFWDQVNRGLHYQYMRNTLQLNMGVAEGVPVFSDVAQLAGISSTDWSWSVLSFDYDNDSHKDVFVTNGTRRDINNKDFFEKANELIPYASGDYKLKMNKQMPSQMVPNYLYKNTGDFQFEDVTVSAGVAQPSFSNGVAYGDLDNDGDLDLVVNNIDQEAFVYENQSSGSENSNYLQIDLKGSDKNRQGIGAKVYVTTDTLTQFIEQMTTRGFQSTVSDVLHFGLGSNENVDAVKVVWPDGKVTKHSGVEANQRLVIQYDENSALDSSRGADKYVIGREGLLFKPQSSDSLITYTHQENDFNDFDLQVLLPHKMSQFGPALAVADFNGDQLDDIFVGGSLGDTSRMFLQNQEGGFTLFNQAQFYNTVVYEDVDALSLDFDDDGDLDLYVVSGGNEYESGNEYYRDRLYINDGSGQFSDGSDRLPDHSFSGAAVRPCDFDKDGDIDLFVGGRHVPHQYPSAASGFLYEFRKGNYVDVTKDIVPDLIGLGMITDASWSDFDGDGNTDLLVVGEWMAPVLFKQTVSGEFIKKEEAAIGLHKMHGWWFSSEVADIDNDGDMDVILGNLGLNYKYQATKETPFKVYASDFDKSGSQDIVLSYEQNGTYYPVRGKQCSSEQIPDIKKKYKTYNSYAMADVKEVYGDMGLDEARELNAYHFASVVLLNDGTGHFASKDLPPYSQITSINDIEVGDYNKDGFVDLILVGNLYASEVETTRNDAGFGFYLEGRGDGSFKALMPYESGFWVKGDSKKVDKIDIGGSAHIIVARNNDKLSFHRIKNE